MVMINELGWQIVVGRKRTALAHGVELAAIKHGAGGSLCSL